MNNNDAETYTKSIKSKRKDRELVFDLNMNNGQLDITENDGVNRKCISLSFTDAVRLKKLLNQNIE